MRDARCGMRRTAPELSNRRVFASLQMIHGAIVDQPPPRDLYDHLFLPRRPIHAVVRDAADRLGGKLPLRRNRLHIRDRSISTPTPPFAAISADDDVRPAAPMSWIATMWPEAISSRLASRSSFSVKGSPTWTCGRRRSLAWVSSSDANDAPWIPSRPVLEPTTTSTLPTPCAAAVIRSASRSSPTHMALTSGFPL